jgi:hypothetical protein
MRKKPPAKMRREIDTAGTQGFDNHCRDMTTMLESRPKHKPVGSTTGRLRSRPHTAGFPPA